MMRFWRKTRRAVLRSAVLALAATSVAWAAEPAPAQKAAASYTLPDFAKVPKVDIHMHLHGQLPGFIRRAQQDNFRLLTINVDYADFPAIDEQQRDAVRMARDYPRQVAWVATFPFAGFEAPGWTDATIQRLNQARTLGAQGVKVWKNLGLGLRDKTDKAPLIDDPRFAPLFNALERDQWLMLGHQAEPRNAWLPVEQMTTRNDKTYFTEHPHYHMAKQPQWPDHTAQLAARDHFLQMHPKLAYLGLHLASLEWSVDRLAQFLDQFPQANVDLAARIGHLQYQASQNPDAVRNFMLKYQDRVLYGSDMARAAEQSDAEFTTEVEAAWKADWRFLVTADTLQSSEFDAPFKGLALPAAVVDKIYFHNARRLFPQAWR